MSADLLLPALPLGGPNATILRWLKTPGQPLIAGEPLLIIINDRAELALPAPAAGMLDTLEAAEGTTVTAGALLARYAPAAAPDSAAQARPQRATPVARRIAAALGVDLRTIVGSGPDNRVLKCDVLPPDESHTAGIPQLPAVPFQGFTISAPISGTYVLSAVEADMSRAMAQRTRQTTTFAWRGLTPGDTTLVASAAVAALLRHPLLNSAWADTHIIIRRRVHLALALAGPDGRMLNPVIHDAQDLNLLGLRRAIALLSQRAQAGTLGVDEQRGATFTIAPARGAWLGPGALTEPQSALLSIGATRLRPVALTDAGIERIGLRPIMLLTLAYDARILDQLQADAFLCDLRRTIEQPALHKASENTGIMEPRR